MKTITTIQRVMTMALVAVMFTTVFTACGSDDPQDNNSTYNQKNNGNENGGSNNGTGDNTGGDNGDSTENTYTLKYFVPCTNWEYTKAQVADWMKNSGLDVGELYGQGDLTGRLYVIGQGEVLQMSVGYVYGTDGKLEETGVTYNTTTAAEFQYIVKETERVYGVTLEQNTENVFAQQGRVVYQAKDGDEKYIQVIKSKDDYGCGVSIYKNMPPVW